MQLRCITDGFVSQSPIPHDIFYPRVTGHLATDLWKKCFSHTHTVQESTHIHPGGAPFRATSAAPWNRAEPRGRPDPGQRLDRGSCGSDRPSEVYERSRRSGLGARKKGSMRGCEGPKASHHLKLGVSHRAQKLGFSIREKHALSQGSTRVRS